MTAVENCAAIDKIIRLVAEHPRGNAVRFAQVFISPMYCKLPSMTDIKIPNPTTNHYSKFKAINTHILKVMSTFGTGFCFGSIRKHHFGYTRNLKHWNYYAWQGCQIGDPISILNCDTLKVELQKERSIPFINSMNNELKQIVGK